MKVSGAPNISAPTPKSLTQVTGTRKGDKRGMDVNIIGDSVNFDNAYPDPRFSTALDAGESDFYFYNPVPANTLRTVLGGVFTSTVYWKVELIVDAVAVYTIIGSPFETLPVPFKGFKLPAGETLTLKFTNMSSNPATTSIYSTLEFSDEVV